MSRLESGVVHVNREWQSLEEVIGAALARLEPRLEGRDVQVHLPPGPALVPLDEVLIEQVIFNLLENALKYTPPGTAIEIRGEVGEREVTVEILDRGPGLPSGEENRVFEKFYRAREEDQPGGIGLGLTVARGIVEAHGGTMSASNRAGGGAAFRFTLPIEGEPPRVEAE
jgi:two-component system sensor histidine kinase KdpD